MVVILVWSYRRDTLFLRLWSAGWLLFYLSVLSGFHHVSDAGVFISKWNDRNLIKNYIWWQRQEADSGPRNAEPQLWAGRAVGSDAPAVLAKKSTSLLDK